MRKGLMWAGAAVALLAVLLVGFTLLFDWNVLKGRVAREASAALGRQVAITGDLDVSLLPGPRVSLEGVQVANADWAEQQPMLEIARLAFDVGPLALLRGRLDVSDVVVEQPRVLLERNDEGVANWQFGGGGAASPGSGQDRVSLGGSLQLDDARISYRDAAAERSLDAAVAKAAGRLGYNSATPIDLKAQGTLDGRPFTLDLDGPPLDRLVAAAEPVPFKIGLGLARSELALDGQVLDGEDGLGVRASLRMAGPDLADPFPLLGVDVPHTPPYEVTAQVSGADGSWQLSDITGRLGAGSLTGEVALDLGGAVPSIEGMLVASELDVAAILAALPPVELPAEADQENAGEASLPGSEIPLDPALLRRADVKLSLVVESLRTGGPSLDGLHAAVVLEDGLLVLRLAAEDVAESRLQGKAVIDGRGDVVAASADVTLQGLPLAPLLEGGPISLDGPGEVDGRFLLEGKGRTLGELLEGEAGRLSLTLPSGRIGDRAFAVDGEVEVIVAPVARLHASGLHLANAAWGSEAEMLRIERLEIAIDLMEALRGEVDLVELRFEQPRLLLEKSPEGEANWSILESPAGPKAAEEGDSEQRREAAAESASEQRRELPEIDRLEIVDGTVVYLDPARDIEIDSTLNQVVGSGEEEERTVSLEGNGRFEGEAFRLAVSAGSLNRLRSPDEPYPVDARATIGETALAARGSLNNPLAIEDFTITLELQGADMAALFPIFGIPIPPTPPYDITGRLTREGTRWRFEGFAGRVGDSDLAGNLAVETGREQPFMEAELVSELLDINDLAGFIGATPAVGPGETASPEQVAKARAEERDDRVLPDMPINLERLHAMDMNVRFQGKSILSQTLPIDQLDTRLILEGGVLRLDPLSFGVAGGSVAGTLVLDGRSEVPAVSSDLQLRRLSLKAFFEGSDLADEASGIFGGRVRLTGRGRSLAEVLATSDGRVAVVESGGSISGLLVELMGIDIAESLLLIVEGDTPVGIRCAIGVTEVAAGVMTAKTLLLDTTDSTVTAEGWIDLGRELLDLRVLAHPKDPSLLSARAPVLVEGRFADPEISVDAPSAIGSLALSIVMVPVSALDELVDLGLGEEDQDCGRLVAEGQRASQ